MLSVTRKHVIIWEEDRVIDREALHVGQEKSFLVRTTAGSRELSKDRGQMEHGLDGNDKGKDRGGL
jgi:hypothetical protein